MRGTHTVHIIIFKYLNIFFHFRNSHYIACLRSGIVMINTQKLNSFIIEVENIFSDIYMLKAYSFSNNFLNLIILRNDQV